MIHPSLIRLKNYTHDPSKYQYKAQRVVDRILNYELLKNPVIILVYSTNCGHCLEFIKDTIVQGRRQKSLWRRLRHKLLHMGFTVIQINVSAMSSFHDEIDKVQDTRIKELANVTRNVNGVPSIIGMDVRGESHEYEGPRTFENLVQFMKRFEK